MAYIYAESIFLKNNFFEWFFTWMDSNHSSYLTAKNNFRSKNL